MKKAVKIIGLCCVAVILVVGIRLSIPSRTLDFRGAVTDIETVGDEILFHLSSSTGATYLVAADSKTDVSPCHRDDPGVTLADIDIGDTIEGDYRRPSEDQHAQFITVQLSH